MTRSILASLLLAGAAAAQPGEAPANGVEDHPRRGTYVETSLGIFTAVGGSRTLSDGEPYLGLSLGREVGERAAIFVSLGLGAASATCYQRGAGQSCLGSDSFGATFIEGGASYGFVLAPRAQLGLLGLLGLTDFSPAPVQTQNRVANHLLGVHVGTGLSFDYDTRLDHFGVGVDALLRFSLARYHAAAGSQTLSVPSLAVMPRIRYVF